MNRSDVNNFTGENHRIGERQRQSSRESRTTTANLCGSFAAGKYLSAAVPCRNPVNANNFECWLRSWSGWRRRRRRNKRKQRDNIKGITNNVNALGEIPICSAITVLISSPCKFYPSDWGWIYDLRRRHTIRRYMRLARLIR